MDHPFVLWVLWLNALHTSSLAEFDCKRLTNLNEIRGALLFRQEKVKQSTQFKKTKSTCCWKAGWVFKDSVVISFRNQNYWLETVIPPNLPAHSQGSSLYYRFQSFHGRVTLNDKHTNSNQHEQSISQICVTTNKQTEKIFKNMPHFSEMKRSIKHLVVIYVECFPCVFL